jgi:hypothetical protein
MTLLGWMDIKPCSRKAYQSLYTEGRNCIVVAVTGWFEVERCFSDAIVWCIASWTMDMLTHCQAQLKKINLLSYGRREFKSFEQWYWHSGFHWAVLACHVLKNVNVLINHHCSFQY